VIPRPDPSEYSGFDPTYIDRVPHGSDVMAVLAHQPAALRGLASKLSDAQSATRRVPAQWSVKEVIGHLCDTERIFAYRVLRIARNDATPLAGFDQDAYVASTDFNSRSLADLLDEFEFQRRANNLCFGALTATELERAGVVNDHVATVRAILYAMAGHILHHFESLRVDYGLA
jgi:uncharacterized damage-inducible protein DinB